MESNRSLANIRKDIENHVGEKVTLKANGGRRKILVNDGVIESVHPSIFVVRLENDTQRTVTYSYSDVLTKTVLFSINKSFEKISKLLFILFKKLF